ncbi:hypothetical protein GCM10029976_005610 [Kribbella albertanoniae]|uniref:Uncharacterized protein n=1 Tax=Kribbella albertanoniae TaxID=1266829 RepID=A0A4R4QBE3_9ACTN|nr:hypothetical protein [Kribbella albertanoniae]TDC32708.1 hypothetical protein E1261_07850 [Kribbella albertanoniae]
MNPLDEFRNLKTLDPATSAPDPHSPRAQATLERILATDPVAGPRPHRLRRPMVRALVATAAVAIGAATVLLPREGGPFPNGDAYAGWTPQPAGMSAKQQSKAVAECRESLKEMDEQVERTDVAIAERRGNWAMVILTGPDQFEANCLTHVGPGRNRSGFGHVGGPGRPLVGPRDIAVSGMGAAGGAPAGYVTVAEGRIGSDIVGMTYTSPTRGVVKATVANGYFAFWLPGWEFDGNKPVPVRVTYRDGTSAATTISLG